MMLDYDGLAHFDISKGKVQLVPLAVYNGKPVEDLLIQRIIKQEFADYYTTETGCNGGE